MKKNILVTVALFSLGLLNTSNLQAQVFADTIVNYNAGTGATLTNSNSALGSPDDITGEVLGFPNVLSPFSPAFESDEIVQIGDGGSITLRLPNFAVLGAGAEIGVFTNVGLSDTNFPNGTAGSPATTFGSQTALVEVSDDGTNFESLGSILFDLPANYYTNAGPFDSSAPSSPTFADFGKEFTGSLSDFDGETYPQILTTLDGSAGGTWLDLDTFGLSLAQVGWIRFTNNTSGDPFELDAVSVNNNRVGGVIPEPSTYALLIIGGLFCFYFAKRNKWLHSSDAQQRKS